MHVTVSYSTRHAPAKEKARGGLNPSKLKRFPQIFFLSSVYVLSKPRISKVTFAVLVRLREVLHNERTVSSFLIILALHR